MRKNLTFSLLDLFSYRHRPYVILAAALHSCTFSYHSLPSNSSFELITMLQMFGSDVQHLRISGYSACLVHFSQLPCSAAAAAPTVEARIMTAASSPAAAVVPGTTKPYR